jgi:hypothetical protein
MSTLSCSRHSLERGNPDFAQTRLLKVWVPAFAGMTDVSGNHEVFPC